MRVANNKLDELRTLLVSQTGVTVDRITLATRLAEDLGMDGLDAVEFFERYFRQFNVNPRGFRFAQHFSEEGSYALAALVGWVFRSGKTGKVPISVANLLAAIEAGHWIDPAKPASAK